MTNCTAVSDFFLTGFNNLDIFRFPLFIVFLLMFTVSCLENLLIIVLVITSRRLQTPMYIIVMSISSCEILFITSLVPKMLHDILSARGRISILTCLAQLNIYGTAGTTVCLLYALMSYDRYLAVSNPLRYNSLIDNKFCLHITLCFLTGSFFFETAMSVLLSRMDFCCYNIIDHFHCDFSPLIKLSCSDTTFIQFPASLVSGIAILSPVLFTIFSYMFIIYTVIRIPSASGRKKAFSTCSSHLLVVFINYGILISFYVLPSSSTMMHSNRGFLFVYIAVTPLINPIIYALRNQDIHTALESKVKGVKILCDW